MPIALASLLHSHFAMLFYLMATDGQPFDHLVRQSGRTRR
jgi:hypothetical protein